MANVADGTNQTRTEAWPMGLAMQQAVGITTHTVQKIKLNGENTHTANARMDAKDTDRVVICDLWK